MPSTFCCGIIITNIKILCKIFNGESGAHGMNINDISVWEKLQKLLTWEQIGQINGKRILDFGSGNGITASYYGAKNQVTAIEPDKETIKDRCTENTYEQICGGLDKLKALEDETFDVILCHNVLEYASKERTEIINEFARVIKKGGTLSILKHNKPGRIMQMVVLLNNFSHALELLDGKSGKAEKYGSIDYYEDEDIVKCCEKFSISKIYGMRTFWDLQQNQDIQKNDDWQQDMLKAERRVSEIEEFKNIAFFHHILLLRNK